jgi:hypothetical protein
MVERSAPLAAKCLGERESAETTQMLETVPIEQRSQNIRTPTYVETL